MLKQSKKQHFGIHARPANLNPKLKTAVNSSNIAGYSYIAAKGVLIVTFSNGGSYGYEGVPAAVAAAFSDSPSKGEFLAKNIRGHYRFTKLNNADIGALVG
jgi:hypothetical protein